MNVKAAFRNTMQGRNQDLLFVPFVYGLAAKIANISLKDMVADPSYYTYSLEAAYKLFGYHAIVNNFDSGIEVESCGCELEWGGDFQSPVIRKGCDLFGVGTEDFVRNGRIPVLLEVTKRLVMSVGSETPIVGVLTGPCSLMLGLQGGQPGVGSDTTGDAISWIGSFLTRFVRSLCELKLDAVFIREDALGGNFWQELLLYRDNYKAVYVTLFNIIRAFNSYPVLIVNTLSLDVIRDVHALLKPNGIILCGKRLGQEDLMYLKDLSDALKMCFGLSLSVGVGSQDDLWDQLAATKSFVAEYGRKGFFCTSDGEVPYDVPLELVHDLVANF